MPPPPGAPATLPTPTESPSETADMARPAPDPDDIGRRRHAPSPHHPSAGTWPTWGALALTPDPSCVEDEPATDVGALPEPSSWVATFVRVACEVAAGHRPPAQVQRWTSPEVFATLARRHSLSARLQPRAGATATVVRAVHLCTVDDRVREASCVVHDRGRVRAVALRIEAGAGRWRVTALEIG